MVVPSIGRECGEKRRCPAIDMLGENCIKFYVPKTGGTSPWWRARCGRYDSAACEYISGGGAIVVDGDGSGMTVIFK